ncbi:class I glutamine amidotransferase-like protein [Rickenella mellea]|uniref:Class I glutamine amidotransferase-like protein n=1 Tax=Rickenella mellea TaxID=50990 RepID=A0A4Y7QE39_9AGAM|nr:class I glutamine amidotransferase-like protein [Rickenella mellea]
MASTQSTARILLYTATADYRHDSIPTAINMLQATGPSIHVQFDATEDKSKFTDENLSNYDAVMFVHNTGEVLDDSGKAALQNYFNLGGNFVAVHAASDALRTTQFYGNEVGAFFDYHPPIQNATVDVINPSHPSTRMLPSQWSVTDEMYNFKSDPRSVGAVVVLSANESSYTDPGPRKFNQGTPHPTAWYQEHGAGVQTEMGGIPGRSFYTSLGHLNETWMDELFMAHVTGGITWALQSNTTKVFNPNAMVGNAAQSTASSSTTGSAAESGLTSSPSQTKAASSGTSRIPCPLWFQYLLLLTAACVLYVAWII